MMKRLIGRKSGDVAIIVNDYTIIINNVKYHYFIDNGVIKVTPIQFEII